MKPISEEQLRILVAAAEQRLVTREGFYVIEGEDRPDRRERERLVKRGMLQASWTKPAFLTEKGIEALRSAPIAEDQPDPAMQTELLPEHPQDIERSPR